MEIQRAMADRNAEVAEDRRIEFRIGINVGDIIVDACATVNGGKEHFRKSPDKLTFEHVRDTQRHFVYTHRWRVHDLVIWDKRCTMRRGTEFDDLR